MTDKQILQAMKTMLEPVQNKLETLQDQTVSISQDLSEVKSHVTKIEITEENTIVPRLRLLFEGQTGMNEQLSKLDYLTQSVEDLKDIVAAHSVKLKSI